MKLLDLLIEALDESKAIEIPKEALNKFREVFDVIVKHKQDLIDRAKDYSKKAEADKMGLQGEYNSDPFNKGRYTIELRRFKDFVDLPVIKRKNYTGSTIKGNDYSGSSQEGNAYSVVFIVGDSNIRTTFSMSPKTKKVYIKIDSNRFPKDVRGFLKAIYHELVHTVDPKINYPDLEKKDSAKRTGNQGEKSSDDTPDYYLIPSEFDAESSAIVDGFKTYYDAEPDKKVAKENILSFIRDIKSNKGYPDSKTIDVLLSSKYDKLQSALTGKGLSDFMKSASNIKDWTKDSRYYRKFLERVYNKVFKDTL